MLRVGVGQRLGLTSHTLRWHASWQANPPTSSSRTCPSGGGNAGIPKTSQLGRHRGVGRVEQRAAGRSALVPTEWSKRAICSKGAAEGPGQHEVGGWVGGKRWLGHWLRNGGRRRAYRKHMRCSGSAGG
eukprot:1160823-Pelagomonas_calceolata.AAC.2